MEISDHELGMLEQLTYLSPEVAKAAGFEDWENYSFSGGETGVTVGKLLECFDEEALDKLEIREEAHALYEDLGRLPMGEMLQESNKIMFANNKAIDGVYMSGTEWASIIRYLKESDLKDLTLSSTLESADGDTTLALCFTEKGNTEDAIVAFKGTSGREEWIDNVEGLNVSDTPCQIEALNYIESLPYNSITVTGHSKGSNKAMYVAITSDKVDRCVGYDGQGFSQEFIDKYWAEIEARGVNITNYSVSTDFVHILLFPVPNSNQVYCVGYGIDSVGEHHSPNSLFVTDGKGNLVYDENGKPMIIITSEDASMGMLHEFTTFVLNNATGEDKEAIVGLVSELLGEVFGGGKPDVDKIVNIALSDSDSAALIVAYLVKYMDYKDMGAEDIDPLLEVLGLNELNELIPVEIGPIKFNLPLAGILDYIKKQLLDGDEDKATKWLLSKLAGWLASDYNIDVDGLWDKIGSNIERIDTSNGCANAVNRTGTTRDFSKKVYDALMDAITQIEGAGAASVSAWNSYSGESWFTSLLVGAASKGINKYFSRLTETNEKCKTKIDKVFDNVEKVDSSTAAVLTTLCTELQGINTAISGLADSVG